MSSCSKTQQEQKNKNRINLGMISHTWNPGSQDAAGEFKFEASKNICSEILSQNKMKPTNKQKPQRNKNEKSQTK